MQENGGALWGERVRVPPTRSPGQRSQLLLSGSVGGTYPAGASVEVRNRVTYYTRVDDRDRTQLMRQIDGGAGALIGDLQSVRLSYWDEWGRLAQVSVGLFVSQWNSCRLSVPLRSFEKSRCAPSASDERSQES